MKTRIFLTGASGYLGSLLMERLAELPEVESITGIALSTPRAPLPSKVKFLQMDMRSPDLARSWPDMTWLFTPPVLCCGRRKCP